MKAIFTFDEQNYDMDMPVCTRFAVRAIICKDGKYAMQQSKYGDYKMPGGGIEPDETHLEALLREVREETGLLILPDTVEPFGQVIERRIDCFDASKRFEANTYYYICQVKDETVPYKMTESEIRLGYKPAWASLEEILSTNQNFQKDYWQKRDYKVLQLLQQTSA